MQGVKVFIIGLIFCISVSGIVAPAPRCYKCGYEQIENQEKRPIEGFDFCDDVPHEDVNLHQCADENDCCVILHTQALKAGNVLATTTFHDCFLESRIPQNETNTKCSDGGPAIVEDKCEKIDKNEEDGIEADYEICVCSDNGCNEYQFPEEPTTANGQGSKCFYCGYKEVNGGNPEPIDDQHHFCPDQAEPGAYSKDCDKADDCCVILHSSYTIVNGQTGVNESVVETWHGCKDEVEIVGLTIDEPCGEAPDEIDPSKCITQAIDNDETGSHLDVEVCLCKGSTCNAYNFPSSNGPESTTHQQGKQCYSCGYREEDGKNPQPIGDQPFCMDEPGAGAHVKTCEKGDDCCVELHLSYMDSGKNVVESWHGCREEVDVPSLSSEVDCAEAPDTIDHGSCQKETVDIGGRSTDVEVCTCTNDQCNSFDLGTTNTVPVPTGSTGGSSEGPHNICYNCGYRQVDGGYPMPLPDESHLNMCGDFTTANDLTEDCTGENRCCAITSVFSYNYNEETGENHTEKAVRHGCFNTLDLEQYPDLKCIDAQADISDDCKVFDRTSEGSNIVKEEVCLCTRELCNNKVPDVRTTQRPPDTTTGAGALQAVHWLIAGITVLVMLPFIN